MLQQQMQFEQQELTKEFEAEILPDGTCKVSSFTDMKDSFSPYIHKNVTCQISRDIL